jgi:hypothetical protein
MKSCHTDAVAEHGLVNVLVAEDCPASSGNGPSASSFDLPPRRKLDGTVWSGF